VRRIVRSFPKRPLVEPKRTPSRACGFVWRAVISASSAPLAP
jgi:hypothetical protein